MAADKKKGGGGISGMCWMGGSYRSYRRWEMSKASNPRKKVPAGIKNTRRLFVALASGDPENLMRQRSVEWRCQQDKEHLSADIIGSDSALLPKWENHLDCCLCMCSQIWSPLCLLSLLHAGLHSLTLFRLFQDIKPLGLWSRSVTTCDSKNKKKTQITLRAKQQQRPHQLQTSRQ